jgi:hypothetical protein
MINYKWIFSAFDCKINENGMQDVVTNVHWRYIGTNENGVTAEMYGTQSVGEPNPDAFVPYLEISEEQVIGWMESAMDVNAMNASINAEIEVISHPTEETLPPPFSN